MIKGKKIAAIITDSFHDTELLKPKAALEKAGVSVIVIGVEQRQKAEGVLDHKSAYLPDDLKPERKKRQQIDMIIDEADPESFDGLLLPGGGSPEKLRSYPKVVNFTKDIYYRRKLIAAICHGPMIMISAEIVKGKTMTCVGSISIDLSNAGAIYLNKSVVVDGNIVTSRTPADMEYFINSIYEVLNNS